MNTYRNVLTVKYLHAVGSNVGQSHERHVDH